MNRPTARNLITEADRPAVSVIIPAFNRKDEVQELLAALARQTLAPEQFEIIVVDDGSIDDTLFYLNSLVDSGRENLIFHYQKNQGPGAARNRGMAMAHFFVATGARQVAPPTGGDLEEQELLLLKPEELAKALAAGDIKVLPWVAAVSLGLQRLRELADRPAGERTGRRADGSA